MTTPIDYRLYEELPEPIFQEMLNKQIKKDEEKKVNDFVNAVFSEKEQNT